MEKIYEIILGIAVILNILYTIYSYNDTNKWRLDINNRIEAVESRVENTAERVNHVEDNTNNANTTVEKVTNYLKQEQKVADQSQDSIVKTMMLFETRLYALEDEVYKLDELKTVEK